MTTFFRPFTISLCAVFALAGCSREEPAPPPAAAPAAAKAAAPAAAAGSTENASAEVAGGDPRLRDNPSAEEPGSLTGFVDSDETIGDAPFTVKLTVDIIPNTGLPPYTFIWDFGDATEFSSEQSPTHTYKIPGNFRASVIIKDSKGEYDQDYIDLAVGDPNAPSGLTGEQLMQQVPLEEVLRQAREAAVPQDAGPAGDEDE
ncbi:MAG: PKD domain-containing protein [Deltaproteobacteria bacterium]|nr:PKD domain-containing protein [Deltaproteobacteria bacterium]